MFTAMISLSNDGDVAQINNYASLTKPPQMRDRDDAIHLRPSGVHIETLNPSQMWRIVFVSQLGDSRN